MLSQSTIGRALGFQAQPGQLSSGFSVRSGATPPPGYHQTGEQSEPQHILQRADEHPARKLWDQAAPPIEAPPAVEEKVGDDEDEDDEEEEEGSEGNSQEDEEEEEEQILVPSKKLKPTH